MMKRKARILLIDDDVDFVDGMKVILGSKLYEVIVAYNGDEGLNQAKREKPDLILLDVIMPVKNGFSAAEQFKKDPKLSKIPILMLTAFASKGQASSIPFSRGFELEAEDYLDKSISPEELLATIDKYLEKAGF